VVLNEELGMEDEKVSQQMEKTSRYWLHKIKIIHVSFLLTLTNPIFYEGIR
jgi:hypothetical protein